MFNFFKLSIILLIVNPVFAQDLGMMGYRDYRSVTDLNYIKSVGNQTYKLNEVSGSPFFNENFKSGHVIDIESDNKVKTFLRYDVYNDLFEIKLDLNSESIKILERSQNYQYTLNNEKFVLIKYPQVINEGHYISGNGYVVELTNPSKKAILYKRYYVDFNEGRKATSSYDKDTPPSLDLDKRFIIKFNDEYVKAEDHKRKILDAFPDKQKEIKKFIKSKNFKFRGDDSKVQMQMIETVKHYNSL